MKEVLKKIEVHLKSKATFDSGVVKSKYLYHKRKDQNVKKRRADLQLITQGFEDEIMEHKDDTNFKKTIILLEG